MSSLLKEAIIDAKALREAALKNAEHAVINKYSNEVRKTLDTLLEQEEDILGDLDLGEDEPMPEEDLAMDPGMEADPAAADEAFSDDIDEVPYAAENGLNSLKGSDNLKNAPTDGTPTTVTLDLGALQEHIQKLTEDENQDELYEMADDEEVTVMREDDDVKGEAGESPAEAASDQDEAAMKGMEEEIDLDSLTDAIFEKLSVDMGADLAGWAGRSADSKKMEMEKELAHRRSTDMAEELEDLKKAQEELVFENKKLTGELQEYKKVIGELKEGLNDINLSNARLLYTNRVLRNTSLNERQKNQIVEAISKSDSVAEARTIYNTLQSTVQSTPSRGPQSLSEAINRPSSLIRATRKESKQPSDIFAERMKQLAGIK